MPKTIETWIPSTLEELSQAVQEIVRTSYDAGHSPNTVYVNLRDMQLDETTLTDGSKVYDLKLRIDS